MFGTEAQKDEVIGGVIGGAVEAIAMSEPGAGSDVGAMRCRATRRNGTFVVNGQKTWISEGVEIRGIDTMGGRVVNDVFLNDCCVPAERLIGTQGVAWRQLMAGLNDERLIIAAQSLGHARRALHDTLSYVTEREQFGRRIGTFQALRHRIADLATEVECCQLLVYAVARRCDAHPGAIFPREASMAKLKVTETAKRVALEGMQMMGGYGYACEYDMEGHVRTNLVPTIFGGTSEIQRDINRQEPRAVTRSPH